MKNIVTLAKVLSDVNRVKILALLTKNSELCVCEICDTLDISQPLVSRHLKQMKEIGLILSRQEGKWMLYMLNTVEQNNLTVCCFNEIKKSIHQLPKLITCKR